MNTKFEMCDVDSPVIIGITRCPRASHCSFRSSNLCMSATAVTTMPATAAAASATSTWQMPSSARDEQLSMTSEAGKGGAAAGSLKQYIQITGRALTTTNSSVYAPNAARARALETRKMNLVSFGRERVTMWRERRRDLFQACEGVGGAVDVDAGRRLVTTMRSIVQRIL